MKTLSLKQIPNLLTLARFAACPVNLYLLIERHYQQALLLYIFLAASDGLDGYLARRMNATSRFGSFFDQVADKIVGVTFFAALMTLGSCPAWFVGLVISVSLIQSLGYAIYNLPIHPIRVVFDTLRIGKWNMALQYVWIGFILLTKSAPGLFGTQLEWIFPTGYAILATLQVGVFFSYFFHFRLHLAPDFHILFRSDV